MKKTSALSVRASYSDLFWLFMFGSVIGFILEGIWNILTRGEWANHAATVWGPFCIIYGLGAAVMYVVSFSVVDKPLLSQFAIYALIGSALEYLASLFQETCFGSTSWDYSDQFLNLNGRISFQMTLIWGLLGVIFARLLFPPLSVMLSHMHGNVWNFTCKLLSVAMVINLFVTSSAVFRWRERMEALPAMNVWEEYLDGHFGDERMEEIFPNMVFGGAE